MIRKLLATTAVAALFATGAWAQDTTQPATTAPAATAPAGGAVVNMNEHLASNIIGARVYNGDADNAENIGDVNDLLVNADGRIESVIVGVGGFLGIGEKNVAMNYGDLKWTDRNGDRWLVANATKESLQALPSFDRSRFQPAPATNAMNGAGTAANGTAVDATVPGGTMAPAANGAAAPAADGTMASDANGTMNNNMAATPDATQTGAVDRSSLTEVPADKLTTETLVGTTVYGANDANVGEIADIVLDKASGKVDAVLIDVGGFLGIGEKRVAVGMDKLSFLQDANGNRYLYTTFTKDQLEGQAAYNADTYATDRTNQRLTVQ